MDEDKIGNENLEKNSQTHLSDLIAIANDSEWDALESCEKAGRGQ